MGCFAPGDRHEIFFAQAGGYGGGKRMNWFTKPGSVFDVGPRFPVLDRNWQSSIPGLYMAGDVTGTPDIKAAINAGAEIARHLLGQRIVCKPPCDVHVLIIGGGPGGVSAALEFEKRRRECQGAEPGYLLIERVQLFNLIRNFAKCKPLFYPSTGDPSVRGELRFSEPDGGAPIPSCDLIRDWDAQVGEFGLNVRLGETVTDIQKTDKFRVVTDKGSYVCDRVILCIGKLVHLIRLDVGLEAQPKVFYEPPMAGKYENHDILVVGSTNEALETALALSNYNQVTVVHTGQALTDAEPKLVEEVTTKVQMKKLNLLLSTRVKRVESDAVVVETPTAPALRIKNDVVFPFLGIENTELPLSFFRKIHVAYDRDWNLKRYLLFLLSILVIGGFYVVKKFAPQALTVHTPKVPGIPQTTWDLGSLYPLAYTIAMVAFGVKAIRRWRKHRWRVRKGYGGGQALRIGSLIFFQFFFFFLLPMFVIKDWRAWGLLLPWPLVFNPDTAGAFKSSHFWWWWSLALILLAIPVFTLFHGKKFCAWVCSCGGLAETLGDPWRHYSPKGPRNTRKERQIYLVMAFTAVATVLAAAGYDFAVAGISLSKFYSYTVDLFLIAAIPMAVYPFMGGKVWCRYWCPIVGWMDIVGKRLSRFRIAAEKRRCIACNMCTRYCEVGVDVMKFALKGESFGMWNSSCIGCGICIQVCPTDVLKFGQHTLVTISPASPVGSSAERRVESSIPGRDTFSNR
jgi:NosR/NirI family transcriptional regulator, nitrous oxide reductase regulator